MRVGVRELSHNTSRYLARVKAGEALEVTEHGCVIAQITPVVSTEPRRPRPHVGYANSGDPTAARRVDEFLADGFGR
jgi:antitoxin (DNA-binding transcriptional repressor) of toxin-antitoxin stability system